MEMTCRANWLEEVRKILRVSLHKKAVLAKYRFISSVRCVAQRIYINHRSFAKVPSYYKRKELETCKFSFFVL